MATQSLAIAFISLPETIKGWVASEVLVDIISKLNNELKVNGESARVIPKLILRVVTQDLSPRDVVNELAQQLKIAPETAQRLAEKIYQQAFRPIETDLGNIGVEVGQMITHAQKQESTVIASDSEAISNSKKITTSLPPVAPRNDKSNKETVKEMPLPNNLPVVGKKSDFQRKSDSQSSTKPFILHEDKSEEWQNAKIASDRPSFSFGIPFSKRSADIAPPHAEVEGLKVVHYSSFLTPFNTAHINRYKTKQEITVPKSRWFI